MEIKIIGEAENIIGQADLHPSENEALNAVCDLASELTEALIEQSKETARVQDMDPSQWVEHLNYKAKQILVKAGVLEDEIVDVTDTVECKDCDGYGEIYDDSDPGEPHKECDTCQGQGFDS